MINQKMNTDLIKDNLSFGNYFEILCNNEYVNNESPICVWGFGELLNWMYLEIKENHEGSVLSLISSKLNVKSQNNRAFYHWTNNECPIPIIKFFKFVDLWKNVCKKSDEDANKIIQAAFIMSNYFSTKRGKKVKLPKSITPELAYLIGNIAGDGHLLDPIKQMKTTGDFEFSIEITDETKYILKNYIHPNFEKIFGIKGKFYKYKNRNAYEYYVMSKVLFLFFNKICELPKGKKKDNLHIPKIIKNSDDKIKAYFLGGFFDSDGYITVNKKIGFGLGDKEQTLLIELKKLFEDLGINTRAITKLGGKIFKGWEFSISRDSLLTFINKIPSFHPKKSKRLNKLKQTLTENATVYPQIQTYQN